MAECRLVVVGHCRMRRHTIPKLRDRLGRLGSQLQEKFGGGRRQLSGLGLRRQFSLARRQPVLAVLGRRDPLFLSLLDGLLQLLDALIDVVLLGVAPATVASARARHRGGGGDELGRKRCIWIILLPA